MPRTAVTIVLLAATVIGPCLCCCAFATFFTSAKSSAVVTAQQEPSDDTACPLCRNKTAPKSAQHMPMKPGPVERHCPCCDERATPNSIAEITPVLDVVQLAFLAYLPVESVSPIEQFRFLDEVKYPPGMEQRHFLIDFCHRLRC
jgi:hypothetical protein